MTKSFLLADLERRRVAAQSAYDRAHSQEYRNRRGQFATPAELAREMAADLIDRVGTKSALIEPSCGSGSFLSALRSLGHTGSIYAVEKDMSLAKIAKDLWEDATTRVECADFFSVAWEQRGRFDALIANPPYARHHHVSRDEKERYAKTAELLGGVRLSGLAGLHAYFMVAGTALLRPNGIASWLVPSELFSVNYGSAIREFLTSRTKIERLHLFSADSLQFSDALVSSCVVVVKNAMAHETDEVEITTGSFAAPSSSFRMTMAQLRSMPKWQHVGACKEAAAGDGSVEVGSLLRTRRGIATGGNGFFVRTQDEWRSDGIGREWLTPLVPPPRRQKNLLIDADASGWPLRIEDALLTIPKGIAEIDLPKAVRSYLDSCPSRVRTGYLCSHRSPWYAVEVCEPPQILCTYMGRSASSPFRFIRNRSCAIATNSYVGLYAREAMDESELDELCDALNAIDPEQLIVGGREYGGGLKKLEPKELLRVRVTIPLNMASRQAG